MSVKLAWLIGIPVVGPHQGQRMYAPHQQSGHMTAADQIVQSAKKVLARERRPHMPFRRNRQTLWLYREALAKAGAVEELFDLFDGFLKDKGYLAMGGQIMPPGYRRPSGPRNSCRSRQLVDPQAQARHVAQASQERPFPLYADARLLAQSG